MTASVILYPSIAMFGLTAGCIFALGIARFRAIHSGQVKISYFRSYNEGTQPQRLHLMARHVQNHFEVPPLFHIAVILSFITESAGLLSVILAWLFVAARCLHTYIHLGSNNVSFRFFTFAFSTVVLCGLWIALLISLAGSTS